MTDLVPIKRALISVSDKTDLVPFARRLCSCGAEIISTGGTARALGDAGIETIAIEKVTGFPEMMDGRLKTLHPRVHGGLLALRDKDEHLEAMAKHKIEPIDLVCVNFYPFEKTITDPDVADAEAIEQIDIGGPTLVRSTAKNQRFVAIVTDPSQYDRVAQDMEANDGATSGLLRRELAAAAFARTAAYDTAIAQWMTTRGQQKFPEILMLCLGRAEMELRYGENPHQKAALYIEPDSMEPTVARSRQLHGIPMGFCNLYDADGALELIKEIDPRKKAAAAVIKHANPCGFAVATDLPTAFEKAYDGDPLAAYGGIVALNRTVDAPTAQVISTGKKYLHVIIAPAYDPAAVELLSGRWKDVRLIESGPLSGPADRSDGALDLRRLTGAVLAQQRDLAPFEAGRWQHVSGPPPGEEDLEQMVLAMIVVKHLKSNAVCIVHDDMLVGGGMGQVDRVASCQLAIQRAGKRARGGAAASDGLFPFRDGPDLLIEAGVKAIVQPGGSKRDQETIDACDQAGVTLMLTGRRHFRH